MIEANFSGSPNYDPTKPETYHMYLDANGLYTWAMTQLLPINGFRGIEPETFGLLQLGNGKGKG